MRYEFIPEAGGTNWLVYGLTEEKFSPETPLIGVSVQGVGRKIEVGELLSLLRHTLPFHAFYWQRIKGSLTTGAMTSKLHRTSLAGAYSLPEGGQLILALEYPDNMGAMGALDALESYERALIVHFILGALFAADKTTHLVERGHLPEFLNGHSPQLMADLLSDQWEGEWRGELPPLRSDEDLERMIRAIPEGIFSGEHPKPPAMDVDAQTGRPILPQAALVRQFFPELPDLRPLDAVRLFWAFSNYLWSHDWWRSRRMRAYARGAQGPYADILNRFAMLQAFSRPPVYSYRGFDLAMGDAALRKGNIAKAGEEDPKLQASVVKSLATLWIQLNELHDGGMPPETIAEFAPQGVYTFQALGIDHVFELDEDLKQLHWARGNLVERARVNAAYTPFGTFRLIVPEELRQAIENLVIEGRPGEDALVEHIDLRHLVIVADDHGMWVRFYGESGAGPIARWEPDAAFKDNVMSAQFGAVIDAVLAAVWHDLRVQGERSIRPARTSAQERTKAKPDGRGRRRPRRPKGRGLRVIPHRSPQDEGAEFTGWREWSSEDERRRILRVAHKVAGHRRRLPDGWHPSERAQELAEKSGIFLPPGMTYVRPFVRGKGSGREELDEPDAPPIISQGLALVLSFMIREKDGD